MNDFLDIAPLGYAPAWLSVLVTYGLGVAGYLAIFVFAVQGALRWSRRAKLSDASVDPTRPLAPGEAIVVGVVEPWPDASPAVRVEIEQEGSEQESSGSWTHVWAEKNRRMNVRPFYLRRASGERVLVEPTREALLLDALDGLIHLSRSRRIRTAELTPGETVIATGVLGRAARVGAPGEGGGYRDGALGWVLKPSARERMVLSTEPLGARFLNRARRGAVRALVTALVFCGVHTVLLGYHLRVFRGVTVVGTLVEHRHYTRVDSEGDTTHHYVVSAELAGAGLVTAGLTRAGFARTSLGTRVAVRAVPSAMWVSTLGVRPRADAWLLALVGGGALLILLLPRVLVPARWDEEKVSEGGPGRLSDHISELPTSDLEEAAEPASSSEASDDGP